LISKIERCYRELEVFREEVLANYIPQLVDEFSQRYKRKLTEALFIDDKGRVCSTHKDR
jgi:hypothetical protein